MFDLTVMTRVQKKTYALIVSFDKKTISVPFFWIIYLTFCAVFVRFSLNFTRRIMPVAFATILVKYFPLANNYSFFLKKNLRIKKSIDSFFNFWKFFIINKKFNVCLRTHINQTFLLIIIYYVVNCGIRLGHKWCFDIIMGCRLIKKKKLWGAVRFNKFHEAKFLRKY